MDAVPSLQPDPLRPRVRVASDAQGQASTADQRQPRAEEPEETDAGVRSVLRRLAELLAVVAPPVALVLLMLLGVHEQPGAALRVALQAAAGTLRSDMVRSRSVFLLARCRLVRCDLRGLCDGK
jgi:hypothetical protein